MKKHILIIIGAALFAAILAFTSCDRQGDEIVRTLKVEKTNFIFDRNQQSASVEVTADDRFSAEWIGDEWGSVEALENKIVISVDENAGNTMRHASVKVFLANELRTAVIDITQNGSNPLLDIVPDRISFPLVGGVDTIRVTSDLAKWNVVASEPWITTESYFKSNEIIVRADKNDVMESKFAKLTVTVGQGVETASKEVEITIDPLTRYFLPYYDFNAANLIAEAREFLEGPELYCQYLGGSTTTNSFYYFQSNSPVYPMVRYQIVMGRGGLKAVSLLIGSEYEYDNNIIADMNDILLDEGFEYLFSNSNGIYLWKQLSDTPTASKCMARITSLGDVIFTAETIKPVVNHGPTFDAVPLPALSWGINKSTVVGWEASNGGELESDSQGFMVYLIPSSTEYYSRWYTFRNYDTSNYDDLVEISVIYENSELSKFFTNVPPYGLIINHNLEDLLLASGFTFLGFDGAKVPAYYNASLNTAVAILGYATNDNPTVVKYGSFKYFQYSGTGSGSKVMSAMNDLNKHDNVPGNLKVVPIGLLENAVE